jgi:hypothetical protein
MASYRYYKLTQLTTNQVDIGGAFSGDTLGVPKAVDSRPQDPWYFVVGLTTVISSSFTNDFHYSYLRNYWQWKDNGAPSQVAGGGGALEPLGESTVSTTTTGSTSNVLSPYNVDTQDSSADSSNTISTITTAPTMETRSITQPPINSAMRAAVARSLTPLLTQVCPRAIRLVAASSTAITAW